MTCVVNFWKHKFDIPIQTYFNVAHPQYVSDQHMARKDGEKGNEQMFAVCSSVWPVVAKTVTVNVLNVIKIIFV